VESILREIREEAKQNLKKEKEELQQHFNQALSSMEQKIAQIEPDMSLDSADLDLGYLSEEPSSADNLPERPTARSETENPAYIPETKALPETDSSEDKVTLVIGTVSQVEPEFSRIFIDIKEKIKEGDKVYVSTPKGEAAFTVIRIYEALNGAIAEIRDPKKIQNVDVNDKVYIR